MQSQFNQLLALWDIGEEKVIQPLPGALRQLRIAHNPRLADDLGQQLVSEILAGVKPGVKES
ncbi:MAG: hypothetical protein ACREN8_13970 [Candidatus Dormibacteraceae bacterium]